MLECNIVGYLSNILYFLLSYKVKASRHFDKPVNLDKKLY